MRLVGNFRFYWCVGFLFIAAIIWMTMDIKSLQVEVPTMRMAFPYDRSAGGYDPARITLAPEYIFLENIFSPLIEMDIHGAVASGVASSFEWRGHDAVLTMRSDLKTVDGFSITAEDAAFSLKRLLVLSGNTHGNLQDLLCRGKTLHSVLEECPGIVVNGNELILRPGGRKPFLFSMLAAIDFAVIPQRSVDAKTLAITDFRNTTGPYYVALDDDLGYMTLRMNPHHYHYNAKAPQEINLVPMDKTRPTASLEAFAAGKVDLVTTIDAATPEDVLRFSERHSDELNTHVTLDIRNIVCAFTERGRKTFDRQQRLAIGRALRSEFNRFASGTLAFKPQVQFFPAYGEGGLSADQHEELLDAFDAAPDSHFDGSGMTATIVRLAMLEEFSGFFQKIMPGIVVKDGQSPNFVDYTNSHDEMPPLYIAGPDTGFLEDIGLISYSMSAGYLNVPKDDRAKWLADYGDLDDKKMRIEKLNKQHFESLMDPLIVPLGVAPYVAIVRDGWQIGFSKLFANNQLWLITRR